MTDGKELRADPAYKYMDSDKKYPTGFDPAQTTSHGIYTNIASVFCAIGMGVSIMMILWSGVTLATVSNSFRSGPMAFNFAITVLLAGIGLLASTALTGVLVEISRKLTK